jgi:hypothetical protein
VASRAEGGVGGVGEGDGGMIVEIFLFWLLLSIAVAFCADRKGRNPIFWVLFSLALSPLVVPSRSSCPRVGDAGGGEAGYHAIGHVSHPSDPLRALKSAGGCCP